MGATEILKYIGVGATLIAFGFIVVAGIFTYMYRREILQAETYRALSSRNRVIKQVPPAPDAHEHERAPAHVG